MSASDAPATKADITELRQFIIEREIINLRWMVVLQTIYFFSTMTAVWFVLAHYKP